MNYELIQMSIVIGFELFGVIIVVIFLSLWIMDKVNEYNSRKKIKDLKTIFNYLVKFQNESGSFDSESLRIFCKGVVRKREEEEVYNELKK
jgi:hypothetical protein